LIRSSVGSTPWSSAGRGSTLVICEWCTAGVVVGGGAWPVVDVGGRRGREGRTGFQAHGAAAASRSTGSRPLDDTPPRAEAISSQEGSLPQTRGISAARAYYDAGGCLRDPHDHRKGNLVLCRQPSRRHRVDGARVAIAGVPPRSGRAPERRPLAEVPELRRR